MIGSYLSANHFTSDTLFPASLFAVAWYAPTASLRGPQAETTTNTIQSDIS
jgi:hypothetical protein